LDVHSESLWLTDEMFQAWLDGEELPVEWENYFLKLMGEKPDHKEFEHRFNSDEFPLSDVKASARVPATKTIAHLGAGSVDFKQSRVNSLIWAYRDIGYIYAELNPLGKYMPEQLKYMYITMQGNFQSLDYTKFGLSEEDLDKEFKAGHYFTEEALPLREIIRRLESTYKHHMGVEILHIQNRPMRKWIIEQLENRVKNPGWTAEDKIRMQKDVIKAVEFEKYIHSHFIGQKRFSLEGAEALIPAVHYLIRHAAKSGVQEMVWGMAHRGRLNVFTNAMRKPASETFAMFMDNYQPYEFGGTGDVKYHLGQSFDYYDAEMDKGIHISLVANPSHLEAVNPVVEGKTRAIQRKKKDWNRKKVLPVLIHGDSAFSGQGVVAETFNLSQLRGYRTGGTIHIIVNNQIGFTTASRDSRSTYFATDIAKAMPVPILHVNGDDPEAVCRAMDIALKWRWKFGYDVVVDIMCFRKLGHNETDEPSFSHPKMYNLIKEHPDLSQIYGNKLDKEGVWSTQEQIEFKKQYIKVLDEELKKAEKAEKGFVNTGFQSGLWKDFVPQYSFDFPETGISKKTIKELETALTTIPEGFHLHRKLKRLLKERKEMIESGKGLDWAMGEALAMGSLLVEDHHVRLSGEDCARGTFSHRHARWYDTESEEVTPYEPLNNIKEGQAVFSVYDSPLSEFSVLGFEYGYSLAQPNILIIWEAQFGDFVNGAQVIIDQFICSGEAKWFRHSGLVMLLPHAYEGQGPEHSNAYLERYLSLCAENNMQVCNVTTPAQYFHLLRKQMKQRFRKPLIVMTPKSLLRDKDAVSDLEKFTKGRFQTVLADSHISIPSENSSEKKGNKKRKRIILCSGHVYYDLLRARPKDEDIILLRLEQYYPFPKDTLSNLIQGYGEAEEYVWVQEEPMNKGAWNFLEDPLEELTGKKWKYIGRRASSASATGSHKLHEQELQNIIMQSFTIKDGK
jgi:2-oxoglutarate dehydrogenase E1 component